MTLACSGEVVQTGLVDEIFGWAMNDMIRYFGDDVVGIWVVGDGFWVLGFLGVGRFERKTSKIVCC
jgi:hypothetical protein